MGTDVLKKKKKKETFERKYSAELCEAQNSLPQF